MNVVAVKRTGHRDRYYCTRPDGSEASWAVTSAPGLPHDLYHLVAESLLGLRRGFWGMVADGMEPAHVQAVSDHLTRSGDGRLDELLTAEAAVATLFGADADEDAAANLRAATEAAGLAPYDVAPAAVHAVRARAAALTKEWAALAPGRGLHLTFPLEAAQ